MRGQSHHKWGSLNDMANTICGSTGKRARTICSTYKKIGTATPVDMILRSKGILMSCACEKMRFQIEKSFTMVSVVPFLVSGEEGHRKYTIQSEAFNV
jgi:hypothetical protein